MRSSYQLAAARTDATICLIISTLRHYPYLQKTNARQFATFQKASPTASMIANVLGNLLISYLKHV